MRIGEVLELAYLASFVRGLFEDETWQVGMSAAALAERPGDTEPVKNLKTFGAGYFVMSQASVFYGGMALYRDAKKGVKWAYDKVAPAVKARHLSAVPDQA